MRDFLHEPRQVAGFHGLIFYINVFNKPLKTLLMGKISNYKTTYRTYLKNVDQGSGQGAERLRSGAYT
jgi:hypothetical protein